jgi:hypothetical protein
VAQPFIEPFSHLNQTFTQQRDIETQVFREELLLLLVLGQQIEEQRPLSGVVQPFSYLAVARTVTAASASVRKNHDAGRRLGQRQLSLQRESAGERDAHSLTRPVALKLRGMCGDWHFLSPMRPYARTKRTGAPRREPTLSAQCRRRRVEGLLLAHGRFVELLPHVGTAPANEGREPDGLSLLRSFEDGLHDTDIGKPFLPGRLRLRVRVVEDATREREWMAQAQPPPSFHRTA